ncbi:MAG: acyl-CoA thioesterase [Spirochaetota bacterium]
MRIQHCDPGGVVFTPQYFNLFVEVLEDWYADALGYPFSEMLTQDSSGTPAMRIEARFRQPSKLGDILEFELYVEQIRRTTALLHISAQSNSQKRCSMKFLYGFSQLGSPGLSPWPQSLLEKMKLYLCG